MKLQIFTLILLIILTGAVINFAKNNPGGVVVKVIKNISTNITTSQNNPATSTVAGKSMQLCAEKSGVWYPTEKLCEANQLNESECKTQGGEFNVCASACRHNPEAEVCTMQCVLTCTFK